MGRGLLADDENRRLKDLLQAVKEEDEDGAPVEEAPPHA
jgi:hypothetical protein